MWVSQVKPSAPLIAICGSKSVCCGSCGNVHHLRPFRPQASGDVAAAPQQRSRMLRPRCPRGLKPGSRRITPRGGGFALPSTVLFGPHWWTDPISSTYERCGKGGSRAPLVEDAGSGHWCVHPRWDTAVAPRKGPRRCPSGKGRRRGFFPDRRPSPSPLFFSYTCRGVDNLPAASVMASAPPPSQAAA